MEFLQFRVCDCLNSYKHQWKWVVSSWQKISISRKRNGFLLNPNRPSTNASSVIMIEKCLDRHRFDRAGFRVWWYRDPELVADSHVFKFLKQTERKKNLHKQSKNLLLTPKLRIKCFSQVILRSFKTKNKTKKNNIENCIKSKRMSICRPSAGHYRLTNSLATGHQTTWDI